SQLERTRDQGMVRAPQGGEQGRGARPLGQRQHLCRTPSAATGNRARRRDRPSADSAGTAIRHIPNHYRRNPAQGESQSEPLAYRPMAEWRILWRRARGSKGRKGTAVREVKRRGRNHICDGRNVDRTGKAIRIASRTTSIRMKGSTP